MNPTSPPRRRPPATMLAPVPLLAGLLALLLLAVLSACGSGGSDGAASSADVSAGDTAARSAAGSEEAGSAGAGPVASTDGRPAPEGLPVTAAGSAPGGQRAIISTGTVELAADDVGAAVAAAQQVVDRVGGQVTERSSETDDRTDGRTGDEQVAAGLVRARLVLRVPAARFGEAMADLEQLGPDVELLASDTTSSDVTTQVIDVDARVEVARRSIDRVAVLLDGAESITDVVAIEAQLSQREAELASLVQQQTYLGDASAQSTITLSLRRPHEDAPPEPEGPDGFAAGLSSGWGALASAAVVVATVLGAALPWLVLALVLGVPGVALTRRLRRRTPRAPAEASA